MHHLSISKRLSSASLFLVSPQVHKDGKVCRGRALLNKTKWIRFVLFATNLAAQKQEAHVNHANGHHRTSKAVSTGPELVAWYGTFPTEEPESLIKPWSQESPVEVDGFDIFPAGKKKLKCAG